MIDRADCYDYPQYWDLAFRSETKLEARFIEQVGRRYCPFPVQKLLEPGCGGGRLVVEMSARGYDMTGFDLNRAAVRYVEQRLRRRGLRGTVVVADMTDFRFPRRFDLAFNTFNTFRHLTSERAARSHLEAVAANLRPGGVYILGFHLLPPDADPEDAERWSAKHGSTKVTVTLRVLSFDRRRRIEVIRFNLLVRNRSSTLRVRSDYEYRIYTAAQFRRLLASAPAWELCDVFDFWYEIDHPLPLDNRLGDAVFVLRKRP